MTWVLWDILVPLMASFALGTLLGWLLWRRSRKNRSVGAQTAVESSGDGTTSTATNAELPDSVETEGEFTAQESSPNGTALREIEKANITLIGERDEANQALEELQLEAEKMQQRINQLEAAAVQVTRASSGVTTPVAASRQQGETTPVLQPDRNDSEALEALRSDTEQLSRTLDQERKARRATELELLNFKNRHDKLANDFATTVSADEHTKTVAELDAEIESLRQQLAHYADQSESSVEEVEDGAVPETDSKEEFDSGTDLNFADKPQISVAMAAGIEKPAEYPESVEPEESKTAQQMSLKSGYIPKGWSVPAEAPSDSQRDKLTAIKGVGPVLEKALHDCGIYFYRQVASLDKNGMEELQQQIPQFPGRIKRDKWVQQAKALQRKSTQTA